MRPGRPPRPRARSRTARARRSRFGLHRPGGHELRRLRADLSWSPRARGTSSPATPATSRSATAVFYGSGAYALGAHGVGLAFRRRRAAFALLPARGLVGAHHRGAVRADRAARPAAHVHRDHDRRLLHLPADGLQLHRSPAALSGSNAPFITWPASASTRPSTTSRWPSRSRHDRHRLADPPVPVRPAVARHQGRRGPGPRARRAGPCGSSCRRSSSPARSPAMIGAVWYATYIGQVYPQFGVRPAVRPDGRADGLPRRATARSPGPCSARWSLEPLHAVADTQPVVQRLRCSDDPARRRLPHRRPVHAARHRPDRRRVRSPGSGPRARPAVDPGDPIGGRGRDRPPRPWPGSSGGAR